MDALRLVLMYNERLSTVLHGRRSGEHAMPLLHIALHDGFTGEPVTILLDGKEIYRKDHVRTRTQIGRADAIEATHDPGPATVEIQARNTSTTITPTLADDVYLAVSISPDGRIVHRSSAEPFRYM
jgi:hypothetical protein